MVSLFVVFCVLSVASPPEGQHSDATAAAVDEARETRLTRTLEGDRRQGRKVPRGLGGELVSILRLPQTAAAASNECDLDVSLSIWFNRSLHLDRMVSYQLLSIIHCLFVFASSTAYRLLTSRVHCA